MSILEKIDDTYARGGFISAALVEILFLGNWLHWSKYIKYILIIIVFVCLVPILVPKYVHKYVSQIRKFYFGFSLCSFLIAWIGILYKAWDTSIGFHELYLLFPALFFSGLFALFEFIYPKDESNHKTHSQIENSKIEDLEIESEHGIPDNETLKTEYDMLNARARVRILI